MGILDYGLRQQQPTVFPSTTSMVAYYRLESNANDSFGTNHGTGITMSYGAGMKNSGGTWSTGKRIDIASTAALKMGSGYTISLWCNLTSFSGATSNIDFLIAKGQFPYNYRIHTEGTGYFVFYVHLNGTPITISNPNDGQINVWNNVIARLDPVSGNTTSGMSLFVNGVKYQNTSAIGYPSVDNIGVGIGNIYQLDSLTTQGKIDEVAIWKRILSDSECLDIFNCSKGTYLA